jgi:glycosyltransferase involved in cell wall biosynthesis
MPRVSVVIPTYNGEKFIRKAIESVLSQTMRDFELIIVDDASEDQTVEIVKTILKTDSRIKFIALEKNSGGPALPRTTACRVAQGEFLAFIDQDDLYYPNYLEKKLDFFTAHPELHYVMSYAWGFDISTRRIISYEYGGPVSMMLRREILAGIDYFDSAVTGSDDVDMWYRYVVRYGSSSIGYMGGEPNILYGRHPNQGSFIENKDTLPIARRLEILLSHIDQQEIDKNNEIYATAVFLCSRIGNFFCLAGKMNEGRVYFRKSLEMQFNLFSLLFFGVSFTGQASYRIFEISIRCFQRGILWRLKVIGKYLKYPESYHVARRILDAYDTALSDYHK